MVLWRSVAVLALVLAACSDPYKQTIEAPDSREYATFVEAMKRLPTDEKNLVNDYVARKEAEKVRPAGITLREAIDEQRRYQAEHASLSDRLIDGAVKVAQALGPKAPVVVQPSPVVTVVPVPGAPAQPAGAQPTGAQPAGAQPTGAQPGMPVTPQPVVPPVVPVVPSARNPGLPAPMTGLEMASLLQEIDRVPHTDWRVERIRQAAESRAFTTRQAIALARTVAFPESQVEILSLLYTRVVDPAAFDEAYAIFDFASDREALRARVDAQRQR